MVTHMKTTIDIADDVLERAKQLAAERKTTLKSLAEEGLRLILEQGVSNAVVIKPVVTGGNGLRHGLPDDFIDNIRDWAYEDEPSR
jgi:hypothetical protein